MLTISNTVTPSWEQWESIIRGMRNPMNSWANMDSGPGCYGKQCGHCFGECVSAGHKEYIIGVNDIKRMKQLCNAGTDHRKFERMIPVYADIVAPLYWWKEFDTYKVGTVANSCSTMHKIAEKEFSINDFSHEHLMDDGDEELVWGDWIPAHVLGHIIVVLNKQREKYIVTNDKKYWWQMIQLLPSSYNQKRTIMLNYEVLINIYNARKDHKLDEWHVFCDWIEKVPYADALITLKEDAI